MGDSPPEKAAGLLFPAPAAGEKAQGPDAAALGADSRGATHALDTAAALLAREQRHARGLEANKGRAGSPRLHHAPRGGGSDNDAASPALSVREGRTVGRRLTRRGTPAAGEAPADVLVVAPSLLDPHPVIVPPPGSRLSFAGANSARMARIFRSLPSLEDTLLRRAQEPLCLFNYWQYLADIEAGAEELEFWLSLADYEALFRKHRHFESPAGLSPASQAPQMLSPNPATLRSAAMQRNGRIESGALGGSSSLRGEPSDLLAQSLSQMRGPESVAFDAETRALDSHLAQLSWQTTKAALATACKAHRQCTLSHRPFTAAHVSGDPTLDTPTRASRVGGLRGFFSRIFSGEP
ncbi:Bud site selection protein, Revert to axial protein 1, partial [Coemansia helicoidea]